MEDNERWVDVTCGEAAGLLRVHLRRLLGGQTDQALVQGEM